jgi:hypothetical protein
MNEQIKKIMNTLLLELRNIKLALINSSKDLNIIFKSPLDHLKTDVKNLLIYFKIILSLKRYQKFLY